MPRHFLGLCAVSSAIGLAVLVAAEPSFAQRGGNPSGQVPGGRGGAPPPPPQAPPNPGSQRPAGTAPAREPGRGAVAAPIPDARYVRERMMDRKEDAADKCGPPGVSPRPDRFDWDAWWETGAPAPAPSRAAGRGGADAARTAAEVIRRLLADPDPIVVEAAIVSLGAVAEDEDVAKLAAIATGPDASLRFAAAIGLAASGAPAAASALRERLLDPREAGAVRGAAALGLGALGDASSAPERSAIATNVDSTLDFRVAALLGLGASRDVAAPRAVLADAKAKPAVRCAAAVALGKSADPSAPVVEALVAALEAAEPDVRGAAAAALGALARGVGREKLGPSRDRATAALARVGATDESIPVRGLATIALGEVDGKGGRDALRRALNPKNDNVDVRAAAALGLGLAGDVASAPALLALLRAGEEEPVAAAAATALGLLRDASALGALVKAVETDGRPWVRAAVAEALGRIGSADAAAALEKRVKAYAEDPDTALAAVVALARIGGLPALGVVRLAAADRSNAILAARALAALGESGPGTDMPLLATTAQDDAAVSTVRAAAIRAIARLGSKGEPVVERILSDTAVIPVTETLDVLSALR